jgi:hypothetical protein
MRKTPAPPVPPSNPTTPTTPITPTFSDNCTLFENHDPLEIQTEYIN